VSVCIFCQIIERKISGRILFEDDRCIAFSDVTPQAPIHALVVPKRHIPTLLDLAEGDKEMIGHLVWVANQVARDQKIDDAGFRTVLNCKGAGGQTVYHIHLHLLGGRQMMWPPG
jgi:histidine triad (HIT) family protein